MNATPQNFVPVSQFGRYPCEGPQCVTIDLDFVSGTTLTVDLSALQQQGKFSGLETLYINNSLNTAAINWTCEGSNQTGTIPPLSLAYINILQSNPPKVDFVSTGGVLVRACFLNYFLPPIIWSPTTPPGGGAASSPLVKGAVTDKSGTIAAGGVAQTLMAANTSRQYALVQNPSTATEILQIRFAGGGWIDLVAGQAWESTSPFITTSLIEVVAATNAHAFSAYEG